MANNLQVLSDAELDAVAGGQQNTGALGLVAAALDVDIGDINIVRDSLNNWDVDLLNNNQVLITAPIGVAVAVLGAAGAVAQGRAFQNMG